MICHSECNKLGIASNRADVMHWHPKHGKPMDKLRADVKKLMNEETSKPTKQDEPSEYARKAWNKAKACGVLDGSNPRISLTREQLAIVLDRLKLIG